MGFGRSPLKCHILLLLVLLTGCATPTASQRDQELAVWPAVIVEGETQPSTLAQRMNAQQVPGLSVALIREGRLAWRAAYGVETTGGNAIQPQTLFQAGSLAKPLTALVALRLAAAGRIDLDADLGDWMRGLGLQTGAADAAQPVTLRGLLEHRAGINPGGYPGYAQDQPLPTLVQILQGVPPSTSVASKVVRAPGSRLMYSGAGYSLAQRYLSERTGEEFDTLMQRWLLQPLGMRHSDFALRKPGPEPVARGHDSTGQLVPGGWRMHPEAAAAGLWTTAEDLARLLIELHRGWQGRSAVFDQTLVRQLLARPSSGHVYGFRLLGEGEGQFLVHYGGTQGYAAGMALNLHSGQGAVYLSNGAGGRGLGQEFLMAVAKSEGWAEFQPQLARRAAFDPVQLASLAGTYPFAASRSKVKVEWAGGELALVFPNGDRYALMPQTGEPLSFIHLGSGVEARFIQQEGQEPKLLLYGDEATREALGAR